MKTRIDVIINKVQYAQVQAVMLEYASRLRMSEWIVTPNKIILFLDKRVPLLWLETAIVKIAMSLNGIVKRHGFQYVITHNQEERMS